MKNLINAVIFSLLLIPSVYADYKKSVQVQYQTRGGWSKAATAEVSFVKKDPIGQRGAEGFRYRKVYALIWFSEDKVAKILLNNTVLASSILEFDLVDYLCLFMPTGSVSGTQTNGETAIKWSFKALWPAPTAAGRHLRLLERKHIKMDKRVEAAEVKMMLNDKAGACRHLRLAKRNFLRRNNRIRATQVGNLVSAVE